MGLRPISANVRKKRCHFLFRLDSASMDKHSKSRRDARESELSKLADWWTLER
jgi:hypothetical protein